MNILFLSHYFPPEVNAPATRGYEHCRAWANAGHKVTVITCAPNHPFGEAYEGYQNRYHREEKDGIDIIRVKTYMSANKGFIKRTASYISFMFAAIWASICLGKYDVVLTTSPQFFNGLAGYVVSRWKRIPWVLEIRDLWPDSILAVDAFDNKFIINTLYWLEKFAYSRCAHIVTVTDSFKKYMLEKGIPSEKISVIKNGVDLNFFDTTAIAAISAQDEIDLNAKILDEKFVASYVGTHGMAHHLETVLEAASILKADSNIHFLLVGDGAEKETLLKLKEEMQLDNVTLAPQKPKVLMPWIWSKTDVSIVHLRKDPVFESVIPSKIFESMAMRKAIIHGVEGESANMIEQARSGIVVQPENAQQLAEAVAQLASNEAQLLEHGRNGRRYVENFFDRNVLAHNFETLLMRVTGNASAPITTVDELLLSKTSSTKEFGPLHTALEAQRGLESSMIARKTKTAA